MYEDAIKEDEEQYLGSDDLTLTTNLNHMGLSQVDRLNARFLRKPLSGKEGGGLSTLELQFAPMQNWNILLSQQENNLKIPCQKMDKLVCRSLPCNRILLTPVRVQSLRILPLSQEPTLECKRASGKIWN